MSIDFGQRDLRGTDLYAAVEEHFQRLHAPAFGRPSAAADPDPRPDGAAIAFTGTVFTELAGHGTARICLAESGTVTTLTDGPGEQRYARFSPDGSLLAYLSDASQAGDFQLRIRDLAAGTDRTPEAVSGTTEYLQFAPDGQHILLGVAGHGADMSGGEGSGTTTRADDDLPDWMPEADAGPTADQWRSAWVVEVATGKARQVSDAGMNVWEAAWACRRPCWRLPARTLARAPGTPRSCTGSTWPAGPPSCFTHPSSSWAGRPRRRPASAGRS